VLEILIVYIFNLTQGQITVTETLGNQQLSLVWTKEAS